jgi:hypothetical protein
MIVTNDIKSLSNMTRVSTYLNFARNTEEVFKFYLALTVAKL